MDAIIPATGPITMNAISTMHKAVISFFLFSLLIFNFSFLGGGILYLVN